MGLIKAAWRLRGLEAWSRPPGLQLSYLFIGSRPPPNLKTDSENIKTDSEPVFSSKFQPLKKWPLGCHLVPKVPQSDPKGLQNGALRSPFDYFFCKKPTLHPTAYLLCFRHILEVLGPPVFTKLLVETCVGSRSPKKSRHFIICSHL